MTPLKIQIPKGTSEITRPGSRRRLFTTKHDEERIRLASEDRKAKLEIRALRRLDEAAGTHFYEGLERAESEFKLKELFLTELAQQENTLQGLSRVDSTSCELRNETEIERELRRLKFETMEALRQFSF
jgi:hypothetical protein